MMAVIRCNRKIAPALTVNGNAEALKLMNIISYDYGVNYHRRRAAMMRSVAQWHAVMMACFMTSRRFI